MNSISFKLKISIIFLLPTIVLMYLFSTYISTKYSELHQSQIIKLSSNLTSQLSDLVHSLQIERGLSSGYIENSNYLQTKEKLLKQYKITDEHYGCLDYFKKLDTIEKKMLAKLIADKIQPILNDVSRSLSHIDEVRKKVLNFDISFEEKIKYYTDINFKIISAIKIINNIIHNQSYSNFSIEILEKLKEQAGLERAYLFNQLIESSKNKKLNKEKLIKLQDTQKKFEKEFFLGASKKESNFYFMYVNNNLKDEVEVFRNNFDADLLDITDADAWFRVSTKYINSYDKTLKHILSEYTKSATKEFEKSRFDLYIAIVFGVVSFVAIVTIFFILISLINKEEKFISDLRFLAYAFDSHEAMVITDTDGTILKVNNAFSVITGYSKEEAIGANPRVLKSGKHDDKFFKNMWNSIINKGKWSGEIYNKRKNGDIYPELLSITAMKNEEGETINYIAQFLDITELKNAQSSAIYQANHDFLTDIMNRKAITDRLEEEFAKSSRHDFLEAFLFIDLDNFKNINDTYGHKVGDAVLIEFAKRLKSSIRKEDLLARLSGDEFAIVLSNSNNDLNKLTLTVKAVSNKIFKELSRDFVVQNHTLKLGASIGVSIFPLNQKDIDDVIHQADLAMYKAKKNGKNRLEVYTDYI